MENSGTIDKSSNKITKSDYTWADPFAGAISEMEGNTCGSVPSNEFTEYEYPFTCCMDRPRPMT